MPEYREPSQFPGYRVGDDGSVWSCWVKHRCAGGGAKMVIGKNWKRLKPVSNNKGYLAVCLVVNGQRFRRYVHRLVLECFIGPCPDGMESCHFPDKDRTNNALSNLRWASRSNNQADRVLHGTDNRGERHGLSKLTNQDVKALVARRANGESAVSLAREFGVSARHVNQIVKGRRRQFDPATMRRVVD